MVKDRLIYYNQLTGPNGERLATTYRFQKKPNDKYPLIYLPHDSLLNHKSRLIRNTRLWLEEHLPAPDIREIQFILACHDVPELIEGDVSRLDTSKAANKPEKVRHTLDQLLLPEDITRYRDYVAAQNYLERGVDILPQSPLSIIARTLDTIDGNFFAFILMEHYADKTSGLVDPDLQTILDRSYAYVNKIRLGYRDRVLLARSEYQLDLIPVVAHLQEVENIKLANLSLSIANNGYQTLPLV